MRSRESGLLNVYALPAFRQMTVPEAGLTLQRLDDGTFGTKRMYCMTWTLIKRSHDLQLQLRAAFPC